MNFCMIYFLSFFIKSVTADDILYKVGCFANENVAGFTDASDSNIEKSAPTCVSYCRSLYKRFAGIKNGTSCLCGEYYSGIDTDSCDIKCSDNPEQICGGPGYVSIYETAGGALGAPRSLRIIKSLENSIHISWEPPASNLADVTQYKILAKPVFYFNEQLQPTDKNYKYSPLTQTAFLDGVYPGTKYNISVVAVSKIGDGYVAAIEGWTKVGRPDIPKVPQLLTRTPSTMIVQIEPVLPTGGPISSYQIVVVDETLPIIIDFNSLSSFQKATENGLPYYIAAEFRPDDFESVFTVGNEKYYGSFYNAPLKSDSDYHILLGVISTINETKSSYSASEHSQHESSQSHFAVKRKNLNSEADSSYSIIHNDHNSKMVLILSIAVGLFTLLLVLSVIIYFALRVYFKRNTRHSADHQELAVHVHMPNQDYENGYAVGAHYTDDEEPSIDHYRLLREKVKVFPHQNIDIVADIGTGKFGDVKKAVSRNNGSDQMNMLVQRIQDDSLNRINKREMLKEFDMHTRLGKHMNIVSLLGLMEELNVISVIFEYETLSLKSHILESRAVQHYPVYAEKNRRFSTLQERQVLEILVGIAKGMKHMYSLNISHGQLCTRNIMLRDGIHPKVSGFGLVHYHNEIYIPDYTRWQSPEALRSKVSTPKGDSWSFGCLMWEAVTLGGTPYADIRTDEIPTRIVRGLRLAQPQYVSDELYQSMLLCWQNDPDERPSFTEIESLLERFVSDDITPHLLFSLYPSFKYEQYCPHLEFAD